jgi:uncharacterized protein YecT (DUF1311 family)
MWGRGQLIFLGSLFSLAACGQSDVSCDSAAARDVVIPLFQKQLETATRENVRSEDGERLASNSRVRATVGQARLELQDVRTSRKDPNSSKRFCEANLVFTATPETLAEMEKGRELGDTTTITELSDQHDVERNANAFKIPIEYTIQPTDDGKRVFAELENSDSAISFGSELISYQLLRPHFERMRVESERAAAEERRMQTEQEQALAAAEAERNAAILQEAKAQQTLAGEAFDAVWLALDADTRDQLTEPQRAWARRRNAECTIESTNGTSGNREATRLVCLARWNRSRTNDLQRYLR